MTVQLVTLKLDRCIHVVWYFLDPLIWCLKGLITLDLNREKLLQYSLSSVVKDSWLQNRPLLYAHCIIVFCLFFFFLLLEIYANNHDFSFIL